MTDRQPSAGRYRQALRVIDTLHRGDPRRIHWGGRQRPFELVYGWCMSAWRRQLAPAAGELLRLAVRAQHLRRWDLPRTSFADGRSGYLHWRREQARRHAELFATSLQPLGFSPAELARAGELLRKHGLGRDAEVQVLEDCAALTYLQLEHAALVARTEPQRMQQIVSRTLAKMSPPALALARGLTDV